MNALLVMQDMRLRDGYGSGSWFLLCAGQIAYFQTQDDARQAARDIRNGDRNFHRLITQDVPNHLKGIL